MTEHDGEASAQFDFMARSEHLGDVYLTYDPDTTEITVATRGDDGHWVVQDQSPAEFGSPPHLEGNEFVRGTDRYWVYPEQLDRAQVFVLAANEGLRAPSSVRAVPTNDPIRRLGAAISMMNSVAYLLLAVGLVSGVWLMTITEESGRYDETHPYIALGVGVIASGIVQAIVIRFIAAWADAWRSVHDD